MNQYHFISHWRVEGTCGEVADILGDPTALPRWWPSVYLEVQEIDPPQPNGLGRRVRLHTKGWLPYTLTWESIVTDSRYPYGFSIEARGDFVGRGVWTFEQDGGFVNIVYDWRIEAEKPLLKTLTPILRPLFAANHRWAMAQGEESLALELKRRRATNDVERDAVAPPPGPVTYAAAALVGGAAAIAGTMAVLLWRARRRQKGGS
jgi:hypothetical protein